MGCENSPTTGPGRWLDGPRRAALLAAAGLLTVSLVSVSLVRVSAREAIDQEVRGNLVRLSSTLSSAVEPAQHALLVDASQEQTEAYERLSRPLRQVQVDTPGVRFAYSLREIDGELYFVLDGSLVGDSDGDGVEDHSYLMEHYEDPDPAALLAIRTGTFQISDEPYEDQWGRFLSAYAPIVLPDGTVDGVMGVDVTAGEYEARLASVDRAAILAMVPASVMALLGGWGVLWATRRVKCHAEEVELHRIDLERASAAKSRLVANLSHELRSPLTAIMGFCKIAFDETNSEQRRREARGTVRRNCEHQIALLNDLLDLSKAEAGAIDIEPVDVDLDELVRGAVAPSRLPAQNKGVVLGITREGPVPERVSVDPIRVRQVISNLVGNAVKFTDHGSITVKISAGPGVLHFRVGDTGPGMNASQVEALFRPYSQVGGSAAKKSQGAGLGLALCHNLVGLMGGSISVESEPDVGSEFTATIPYAEAGPVVESAPVVGDEGAGVSLSGARIVLAEDGQDNRRLICFFLERAGAEILDFPDGQKAIDAFRDGANPDLVLTDWDMPVLDGEGLVKGLRDTGWSGPIVSLTAHAMADKEAECLAAGCDAHLTKPVNWDRLIGTCASLIARERTRRAA